MSYEPLHHKYRPQTFAQLVGQEAIATTLTSALRQQRIAPAYLFTGARGTGKTSSARILAKSLNCLQSEVPTEHPCGVCEVCRMIARGSALDVIEIDAASNTGVDNIRELIERAQFAPVQCRYKVYVIDEVHMLSNAAFNALLKTLEEPPDRVVFVLATTDPQKVLPTIISRCQRFDFRRIPLEALTQHLGMIAQKEAIAISEEAITLVAQISQGGLRDAESLLDQLSLMPGEIAVEQVWDLVGAVPERDLMTLLEAIADDNSTAVLDQTRHLLDRGREPLGVLQNLASFYRDLLIAKTTPDRNDLVALTLPTWEKLCTFAQQLDIRLILLSQQHLRGSEVQIKNTTQPRLWLEVTLLGLLPSAIVSESAGVRSQESVNRQQPTANSHTAGAKLDRAQPAMSAVPQVAVRASQSEPVPAEIVPEPTPEAIPQPSHTPANIEPATTVSTETPKPDAETDLVALWKQIIKNTQPPGTQALLRQQGHLLAFNGREARVAVSSQPLFKMFQERLPNVEAAFLKVFERKVKVSLEVASLPAPAAASTQETDPGTPPSSYAPPSLPSNEDNSARSQPPTNRPSPNRVAESTPDNHFAASASPEPQLETSLPPVQGYWEEDEVTRAAKRLAEFFAGKVVDMGEDDLPARSPEVTADLESRSAAASLWTAAPSEEDLDDEDDDDDLPF
ncbi:MAG: DNA polymerase III subunit gamma/tau [Scytolyngbya sp. HA4215-MV1]|jgi:DNA polymerase-3 subunit gamma/tau|nr:DNA polymerase III subunit gamma/tau [Scytolyngbya sp. HA4215-MV1]